MATERFEFKRKRDIGKVISDSFRFLFANFGPLLTGFLMYVGPFILIGAFIQFRFTEVLVPGSNILAQYTFGMIGLYLCVYAGYIVLSGYTYAIVLNHEDPQGESINDGLLDRMKITVPRALLINLIYVLAIALIAGVPAVLAVTFAARGVLALVALMALVMVPVILYVMVPLSIAQALFVLEDEITIPDAIRKGFDLVRGRWWETFALILVQGIIVSMIAGIVTVPFYIVMFIRALGEGLDPFADPGSQLMSTMYLVSAAFSLFLSIYQILGLALQYYNLEERVFGVSLKERIQDFGSD